MHLFADYIQPMTVWLHNNPHYALLFTFLISFSESLAIIGSIIPGSVTMTAIGILAGSGIMRVDLTLLAAMLGAVAGDSASYLLGYLFRDKLPSLWPFSRHPNWLVFGKEYFIKHGGKSVLIGRFVGPLRSIIPVIAGMMQMNQFRFLIANVVSAIGWSILYVMPGVVLGAASNELSAENATRLFVLILAILVLVWLSSWFLKWLLVRLSRYLQINLHVFWDWSKRHPRMANLFLFLTPDEEENHFPTAALVIVWFLTVMLSIVMIAIVWTMTPPGDLNSAIHLFLQSLRTRLLDSLFLVISQSVSVLSLIMITVTTACVLLVKGRYRSLVYLASLCITTLLLSNLLNLMIDSPRPKGLLVTPGDSSFPYPDLTFATALWIFLGYYLNQITRFRWPKLLRHFILSLLLLTGFAALYLGDYWFTDVCAAYVIGLAISLWHLLFFRRKVREKMPNNWITGLILTGLAAGVVLSTWADLTRLRHNHTPYFKEFILTEEDWWVQKPIQLPRYRANRIGHPTNLFNIQYAGNLDDFKNTLLAAGWEPYQDTLINRLMQRLSVPGNFRPLPLLNQLYHNRRPALAMTLNQADLHQTLIIRLWRSNYHLTSRDQPIWIGSIHNQWQSNTMKRNGKNQWVQYNPLAHLYPSLKDYDLKTMIIDNPSMTIPYQVAPKILLIRPKPEIDILDD